MDIYIIGYRWCKHFQNAVKLLVAFTPNAVIVPSETPNRTLLLQTVNKVVGTRPQVFHPAPTSPQIVVLYNGKAICVPGEADLQSILHQEDLEAFCRHAVQ